jgi:hypothetical protein
MKLQIPQNSFFFKEENGEILFNEFGDMTPISNYELFDSKTKKYCKELIAACACWEWNKEFNNINYETDNWQKKELEITEQIQLWEKWGNG